MTAKVIDFPRSALVVDLIEYRNAAGMTDWPRLVASYSKRVPDEPAYRGLVNIALHALAEQVGAQAAAAYAEMIADNLRNPPGCA